MEVVEKKIENNILIAKFNSVATIDIDMAKKMVEERLAFQEGNVYPTLVYLNGVKFASSEARSFMKDKGLKGLSAGAFIISNPVEKVIMNFLILISPPEIPTRMFTNESEAIKWLEQYK